MSSQRLAQLTGVAVLLVAIGAVVWAFGFAGLPTKVPDYALQSTIVLRAEMALALIVAAGIPLLFVGRLLSGRFPDRLSPQGAEWRETAPELLEAISELQDNLEALEEMTSSLVDLAGEHEKRLSDAGL